MAADRTSGYDAFISYSHALDGALARALQTGLERFAKPWHRPRSLRVFRDTTSLSANPGLWSSIENALASSVWLVLMASPDAAQSPWVNREVAWWLANKSPQRLLVVLTEGEFAWDYSLGHSDGAKAALPPALRGAFSEEPRWVDLRWLHDVNQVDQSNPRLRECVADIAAAVREVPKDVLVGEHIRQHRRTVRLARGGVTALAVLLIAALVAAAIALDQRNEAREQARIATVRQLVAQAEAARDADPRTALLLGIAAQRIRPNTQTHASLVTTLTTTRYAGTLTGHTRAVLSVAISPDGRTLASGDVDGTVILWNLSDPTRPTRRGAPLTGGSSRSVAFSPDGRTLASGGWNGTVLWDLTNPTGPTRRGPSLAGGDVESVAFSPNGRTLAIASRNRPVPLLWDLTDPTRPTHHDPPTTGHTHSPVYSVAFSPDGHTLASGGDDGTIILWDLTDPTRATRRGPPLTGDTRAVLSVAFSSDKRTLASGGSNGAVSLWDLTDPARPTRRGAPLTGHTNWVRSVAFSPDGHTFATAGSDGTVILWDLSDPTQPTRRSPPSTGHTGTVYSVAFFPDGRTLASGGSDGTVILWDLSDSTRPTRRGESLAGHSGTVTSVVFSPDGRTLASSDDGAGGVGSVILWDLSDLTRPTRRSPFWTGHDGTVHDSTVSSVAFSPDGRTLATASVHGAVFLWDLSNPTQPTRRGPPLTGHTNWVYSVAFSPDGRTLATASNEDTAFLWDLTDPARPTRRDPPLSDTNWAALVAFSPDGHTLATTSYREVLLWDLANWNYIRDHATERACILTGRGLNRDEWARYIPGLAYQNTCRG